MVDNEVAVRLAQNPEYHCQTKHIKTTHFFVRELVSEGSIEVKKVATKFQVADILTNQSFKPRFSLWKSRNYSMREGLEITLYGSLLFWHWHNFHICNKIIPASNILTFTNVQRLKITDLWHLFKYNFNTRISLNINKNLRFLIKLFYHRDNFIKTKIFQTFYKKYNLKSKNWINNN